MTTPHPVAGTVAATPATLNLGTVETVGPSQVSWPPGRSNRPDRLRIAVVAPPWFAVPPPGYGGIERVVEYLVNGLCRLGHEVTLFASGGSRTAAKLVSVYDNPPSTDLGDAAVEMAHTLRAFRMARQFDIIHDHTFLGLASAVMSPTPVVHTIHGALSPAMRRLYLAVSPPVNLITISEHQKSTLPAGLTADTVYNGIDVSRVPFGNGSGGYLLFVGRMNPDKGVLDAIEIARRTGERLMIMAKVNEPLEQQYFSERVLPALKGIDAEVLQQPPEAEKLRAYANAKATLFPIRWPEPFGLVMVESMASGTPVIAYRNGSVPEVIRDGETGFICDSFEEAVAAVGRVGELSRRQCREHVAANFSAQIAVERHLAVYQNVLARGTIASEHASDPTSALVPAGGAFGSSG